MWSEFPDDESMYTIDTQFMLGDALLIAPKITTPTDDLEAQQLQEVTYTLPMNSRWYNSNNV
jgi:alpha-glucosidase (family GH31 glycosyl hydrolase)